jgi:hypothetical protein
MTQERSHPHEEWYRVTSFAVGPALWPGDWGRD